MTLIAAVILGVGLGLAYFGGLWVTTRRLTSERGNRGLAELGRLGRLAFAAGTLYALSREGVGVLLAGLVGLWLARGFLIHRLGGAGHDR